MGFVGPVVLDVDFALRVPLTVDRKPGDDAHPGISRCGFLFEDTGNILRLDFGMDRHRQDDVASATVDRNASACHSAHDVAFDGGRLELDEGHLDLFRCGAGLVLAVDGPQGSRYLFRHLRFERGQIGSYGYCDERTSRFDVDRIRSARRRLEIRLPAAADQRHCATACGDRQVPDFHARSPRCPVAQICGMDGVSASGKFIGTIP